MDKYNGLLSIYKESGYTSFDVVAILRGILKQKKIGHTGTLDPDAEGVLLVCLGKGTKLCDMLEDHDKVYRCKMIFGIQTDTDDISGKVINQSDKNISEEIIKNALMSFVGESEQIPPMYSAIKVNGKKLYDLAREGKTIERTPRKIVIYDISDVEVEFPYVSFSVSCSKGTYIRSICRDLGEKLGTFGTMCQLTRNVACGFSIENSLKISDVKELVNSDELDKYIIGIENVFSNYPAIYLNPISDKFLKNGNPLIETNFSEKIEPIDGAKYRVYDSEKVFCAIYCYYANKEKFMPEKMFL